MVVQVSCMDKVQKQTSYDDETINIVNDMYKHFHNDVGKLLFMYF
jgi:hypothetical protein